LFVVASVVDVVVYSSAACINAAAVITALNSFLDNLELALQISLTLFSLTLWQSDC
jgi:Na+/glutamate symporter